MGHRAPEGVVMKLKCTVGGCVHPPIYIARNMGVKGADRPVCGYHVRTLVEDMRAEASALVHVGSVIIGWMKVAV